MLNFQPFDGDCLLELRKHGDTSHKAVQMIANYLFDQYVKVIWPLAIMYVVMIWRLVHLYDYRLGGERE